MKNMNHAAYQAKVRKASDAELRYIIKDASEAAKCAQELGSDNEGYYLDEVNYASQEMHRRIESSVKMMARQIMMKCKK